MAGFDGKGSKGDNINQLGNAERFLWWADVQGFVLLCSAFLFGLLEKFMAGTKELQHVELKKLYDEVVDMKAGKLKV